MHTVVRGRRCSVALQEIAKRTPFSFVRIVIEEMLAYYVS